MSESSNIAVVGAGPAGLAAAWTLAGAGARVTVYERHDRPGGRMRTDVLDGVRVDAAVQLLGSYYRETFRLARQAGAADLLVRSSGRDALWRDGRARPLSYGSAASMAVSSALPTGLKLRLAGRYLPFLKRRAGVLDAAEPARAAAAGLDRESIARWGARELGEDFVELMAYPLLASYYAATPERTSAGFYHALARAGTDVAVYAVRGGMGALATALTDALEERGARIRAGKPVRALDCGRYGVELRLDDGSACRHHAAVAAVPPRAAAELDALGGAAAEWLAGVETVATASLALVLDGPAPAEYFGLSFPRTSAPGERVAAVCVEGRKGAGLVPDGRGLLVVFPAPALLPRVAEASPGEALELLLPAVERVFPGIGARVLRAKFYRYREGGLRVSPGYLEHLRCFDPAWLPPRLALAGDYLVAPSVEGAVRSGRGAAERLLERWSA